MKYLSDSKGFIEYSNDINDNYKNTAFDFFDGMIVDMLSNWKLNPIVVKLFITGRKLNISLAFMTQFYFDVPEK